MPNETHRQECKHVMRDTSKTEIKEQNPVKDKEMDILAQYLLVVSYTYSPLGQDPSTQDLLSADR